MAFNLHSLPRDLKVNKTIGYMCCFNVCIGNNNRFKLIDDINSNINLEFRSVADQNELHCILKDISQNKVLEYKHEALQDEIDVMNLRNVEIKKNFKDYCDYASGIVYYRNLPKLDEEKLYCGFTRTKPTQDDLFDFQSFELDKYGNLVKVGNNRGDMKFFSCAVFGVDKYYVTFKPLVIDKTSTIVEIVIGIVLFIGLFILMYVIYYQDKSVKLFMEEDDEKEEEKEEEEKENEVEDLGVNLSLI